MFHTVWKEKPEIQANLKDKIIPVEGDLVQENLGIPPDQRKHLIEELDVIISSAASINFTDPLLEALQINYFGTMRLLDLAKECKHLEVYHHISTAYVNGNLPPSTRIQEKIYPYYSIDKNKDVEAIVSELQRMDPNKLEEGTLDGSLLNGHPNTYAFTKELSEKLLQKRRGNLRMVISRPTVIFSVANDPAPGWSDTVSAAGVVQFPVAMGIANFIWSTKDPVDFINGDLVSNTVLVSTAYAG